MDLLWRKGRLASVYIVMLWGVMLSDTCGTPALSCTECIRIGKECYVITCSTRCSRYSVTVHQMRILNINQLFNPLSWNTQEKVSRAIQNIAYFVMQAGHAPHDGAVGTGTCRRVPVGQYLLSQLRPTY
jgi:hypothetical protein